MSAGRIILWRHGQTEYNVGGRLQGQVDIPLNDVGRQQAAAAARAIAAQWTPTRIITSDLSRAVDTAQALGDATGVAVDVDPRLRERSFGQWEGLTHAEIEAGWPAAFRAWRQGEEPDGVGAETRAEVGDRVAEAILANADALGEDDTLVAVAHGAALTLGQSVLQQLDPESWFGLTGLENCRWAILVPNPGRQPAWRLSAYNVGAPAEA